MLKEVGRIMLPVDMDIRQQIINYEGNTIISASAGTGKTQITINKIIKDMDLNTSFKTFAALTFTRKALKEIAKRLGLRKSDGFIGTNDVFVVSEVIEPFMYDVYGKIFKKKITFDFSNENQISNFNEGIKKLEETGLLCKYSDNKNNFAFQLALDILGKSHSAQRYLKSKYFRIFIDEYQDCDVDMHQFFMYLWDSLMIPFFVVGDIKQSIYGWRGAYCDGFKSLIKGDSFKTFYLFYNFRSNQAVQNYSNMFMESVINQYNKINFNSEIILFIYSNKDEACNYVAKWIEKEKNCAILSFRNDDAISWSNSLNELNLNFMYIPPSPIEDAKLESEHIWIPREFAKYFLVERYSEYDFIDEIPIQYSYSIDDLKNKLMSIKDSILSKDEFDNNCYELYEFFGYEIITEKIINEVDKLFETVSSDKYIPTYNPDKYKLISSTIHSSKGLEFNQVIIKAQDYDLNREGIEYLHYVALSRAEERILILSQKGNITNKYLKYINEAIINLNSIGKETSRENIIDIESFQEYN